MKEDNTTYDKAKALAEEITDVMRDGEMAASAEDFPEINELLRQDPDALLFLESMGDPVYLKRSIADYTRYNYIEDYSDLHDRIRKRKSLRMGRRLAAFAVSAACLTAGIFMFMTGKLYGPETLNGDPAIPTLVLGNGDTVELNSVNLELLAASLVSASESELVFGAEHDVPQINKLIIPERFTYNIVLADGSRVEMNAGSQLEFPSRFTGDTREIFLTGEAYFTVAPSEEPFVVNTGKMEARVYGTQFNINTYRSGSSELLLVSGSVGVRPYGQEEVMLSPDEMFVLSDDNRWEKRNVDPANYLGWRLGFFSYELSTLGHVLDDISQWYGVDFSFKEESLRERKISLSIDRKLELGKILEILQSASNVKIKKEKNGNYMII